jgi:para-nitrobenzyl esterase
MNRILLFMAIFSLTSTVAQAQFLTGKDVAVTDTDRGMVRGYVHDGIYTYKGIPYGQAKRFERATRPTAWEGIRSSMTYGPVAPLLTPTTWVQDFSVFLFDHEWGYTS